MHRRFDDTASSALVVALIVGLAGWVALLLGLHSWLTR
jgi:hypothetical protein